MRHSAAFGEPWAESVEHVSTKSVCRFDVCLTHENSDSPSLPWFVSDRVCR